MKFIPDSGDLWCAAPADSPAAHTGYDNIAPMVRAPAMMLKHRTTADVLYKARVWERMRAKLWYDASGCWATASRRSKSRGGNGWT